MPPKVGQKFQKVVNHAKSEGGKRTITRTVLEVGDGFIMYEDEQNRRVITNANNWRWWVKGAIALEPDTSA